MTETVRAYRSIFARLVVIMLLMALCLVGMVAGFFRFVVDPTVGTSVDRMLDDYSLRLARDQPGLDEARALAARLQLQIRYQGPDGSWTTDPSLPPLPAAPPGTAPERGHAAPWGHSRRLVRAPNGGRYLLQWDFGQRTSAAHERMLQMLLAAMVLVFVAAHVVLRRALSPLRALQDGVARLRRGDLDVVLENRTRDEFGALTAAFNALAASIKERVRARDQLLLDVSHELRSPLTRLKVALALLPDSAKKTQAEADVSEMESQITELLELERLRDGRGLRIARVDLVPLLHEAARAHQDTPPGVRVDVAAPTLPLDCDADDLRTVLRNLVGNAVKYSLPDSPPVEVTATRDAGWVTIRVVDDGSGVPESDLSRLFEPFFRVDRSRSRQTGGYGLGLSICKRIVEAHGGTIAATNNPARGACFAVRLPERVSGDHQ